MSPKLTRLVLAASVAVGFTIAPMLGAYAADRNVIVKDDAFQGGNIEGGIPTYDALPGDTIHWRIENGEHQIAARDEPGYTPWAETMEPSETLGQGKEHKHTFPRPGRFVFGCNLHPDMKGAIDVKDQSTTTTSTSSTTTTTRPAVVTPPPPGPTTTTTSTPASSAGAKPPVGTPAPTTTTKPPKDKKGKDDKKEEETTTTTVAPPPPPVDLPDSAIIPVLPGAGTGTTTQNGVEAPMSTPEGDAIALLKSKKGGGGNAVKLLIVSGLGLGALGIGTAGYKYANRSSKYFPA